MISRFQSEGDLAAENDPLRARRYVVSSAILRVLATLLQKLML
jgi:hypothetical protein